MTIFSQTKPAQTQELEITFTLSSVINIASIVQVAFYVIDRRPQADFISRWSFGY